MNKAKLFLVLIFLMAFCLPASGAQFQFHGDMNNRFMLYTDRSDWLRSEQEGEINEDKVSATYAEIKYRYWVEAADDENKIKGVYAIEIGGVRFGREGSGKAQGGSFSGDGVNIETRWAYVDFQTPGIERLAKRHHDVQDSRTQCILDRLSIPCGEEVAGHLEYLFSRFGAPLFCKRDNGGNLIHSAVNDVSE